MSSDAPAAAVSDAGRASLGLATCTALVIGNMVGSGFFIAPAALARYGTVALIGWAVMAVGAICLGMVFARLARIAPATGGPYAYTRMGFGRFAGFMIAWGYWISIWASLPAMAAALVGYLVSLVPALQGQRLVNIAIGLGSMWAVALVNLAWGTNFLYLRRKPGAPTLLDWMGPWPVYILVADALAALLFWLLDRPFRSAQAPERAEVARRGPGG